MLSLRSKKFVLSVTARQQIIPALQGQTTALLSATGRRKQSRSVYTMAQKAELPAFKVRGQWRFKRVDIDHWIEAQKAKHIGKPIRRGA